MDNILYLVAVVILLYYILMNNNIEKFTLNFPENSLKCKCNLEDDSDDIDNINKNVKDNNNVEGFTNYDSSSNNSNTKLENRIYNIHNSPYNESASSYYEKKYYYPIKPLDNEFKFEGSNSDKYKNIGSNTDKLLNDYSNNNIESYNYIFGIKSEIKDN